MPDAMPGELFPAILEDPVLAARVRACANYYKCYCSVTIMQIKGKKKTLEMQDEHFKLREVKFSLSAVYHRKTVVPDWDSDKKRRTPSGGPLDRGRKIKNLLNQELLPFAASDPVGRAILLRVYGSHLSNFTYDDELTPEMNVYLALNVQELRTRTVISHSTQTVAHRISLLRPASMNLLTTIQLDPNKVDKSADKWVTHCNKIIACPLGFTNPRQVMAQVRKDKLVSNIPGQNQAANWSILDGATQALETILMTVYKIDYALCRIALRSSSAAKEPAMPYNVCAALRMNERTAEKINKFLSGQPPSQANQILRSLADGEAEWVAGWFTEGSPALTAKGRKPAPSAAIEAAATEPKEGEWEVPNRFQAFPYINNRNYNWNRVFERDDLCGYLLSTSIDRQESDYRLGLSDRPTVTPITRDPRDLDLKYDCLSRNRETGVWHSALNVGGSRFRIWDLPPVASISKLGFTVKQRDRDLLDRARSRNSNLFQTDYRSPLIIELKKAIRSEWHCLRSRWLPISGGTFPQWFVYLTERGKYPMTYFNPLWTHREHSVWFNWCNNRGAMGNSECRAAIIAIFAEGFQSRLLPDN